MANIQQPSRSVVGHGNTVIVYDPRLVAEPSSILFEPPEEALRNTLGRGTAYYLDQEGQQRVLRIYRRGGLMRHIAQRHYLFSGLQRSRMVREFDVLQRLRKQGLPVPEPVAVRVTRRGLLYRGEILMTRLAASATLAERLQAGSLAAAEWHTIGQCVRRLHDAGADHADLNANNIMLGAGEVFLIDFDKATLVDQSIARDDHPNLARLKRSLHKHAKITATFHFTDSDWQALLQGYLRPVTSPTGSHEEP